MTFIRASYIALAALSFAACAGNAKAPVDDDFSALDGLDEKADSFSGRMTIVGSLSYGDTSAPVPYTRTPVYRAFKFAGNQNDLVDVWVRSDDGGDAVAWVLDNSFKIIASNDDADDTTFDSHIRIPLLPRSTSATHYIVFRDYSYSKATFTVELNGVTNANLKACKVDSDCVRVNTNCCGNTQTWDAVHTGKEAAFHATLGCPAHQTCPQFVTTDDGSMAECDTSLGVCKDVKADDIACGGFVVNAHSCSSIGNYLCYNPNPRIDVPGECVKTCGGIAGISCADGYTCVDNVDDNCDPNNGGADCGGVCVPN
jgi:hypothetical protein